MVFLYWDIGRMILDRQERAGWGARVTDHLSADLREAFPDMKGFSPRNLKYMRAFAAAWPDRTIVQETLAQITWYHNITLIEKLDAAADRLWYARQVAEHGWSRNIMVLQIEGRAHQRHGKALTNFEATLPPADSDMAAQVFKDPLREVVLALFEEKFGPPGAPILRRVEKASQEQILLWAKKILTASSQDEIFAT